MKNQFETNTLGGFVGMLGDQPFKDTDVKVTSINPSEDITPNIFVYLLKNDKLPNERDNRKLLFSGFSLKESWIAVLEEDFKYKSLILGKPYVIELNGTFTQASLGAYEIRTSDIPGRVDIRLHAE